jgi:hypothetical protein
MEERKRKGGGNALLRRGKAFSVICLVKARKSGYVNPQLLRPWDLRYDP